MQLSRSVIRFLVYVLILTLVWCLWNESFALRRVIEGLIFGSISLVLTSRIALRDTYHDRFVISPLKLVRYAAIVFVQIYVSGFDAIKLTLRGELNPGIVDIPTSAPDRLSGVLIANAITLTPGTVTIDYDEDTMKVVWINVSARDPEEAAQSIKGSFERVFVESPEHERGPVE